MFARNKVALMLFAVAGSLYVVYANIQCLMGNPLHVVIACLAAAFAGVVLKSLYPALLAFGILMPFDLPNPFVRALPAYHVFLMMCVAGYAVSLCLNPKLRRVKGFDAAVLVFFLIMTARYLAAPSLPGSAVGAGDDVTGFRAWFDFFASFVTVVLLGCFINSWAQMDRFLRSLFFTSLFFLLLFLVLMPLGSYRVARVLSALGVYITFFGNGWFRFVVLPTFGMVLIAASLLPSLFRLPSKVTKILLAVGFAGVVAGGNRISLIAAVFLVGIILFVKRRYSRIALLVLGIILLKMLSIVALDSGLISANTPGVRLLSLVRTDVSEATHADATIEWRLIRWRMAVEDIRRRPVFGSGFGGAKGEMASFNPYQDGGMTRQSAEIYVASGATHNGYLTAARALGIPAALLMIFILLSQFFAGMKSSVHAEEGRSKDVYTFVTAFQGVFLVRLLVGMEPQFPLLWMFIGLGFVVRSLGRSEKGTEEAR